jgi:hypothetical protein
VTDKPDKPKPLFVPDPVAALNKRIQRANRTGLVNLEIEKKLGKPPTEAEMESLGFSESTKQLLKRLQGLKERAPESSVLPREEDSGQITLQDDSDA